MIYEVRSNGDHWEGAFHKRADAEGYARELLERAGVRAKVYEVKGSTETREGKRHG